MARMVWLGLLIIIPLAPWNGPRESHDMGCLSGDRAGEGAKANASTSEADGELHARLVVGRWPRHARSGDYAATARPPRTGSARAARRNGRGNRLPDDRARIVARRRRSGNDRKRRKEERAGRTNTEPAPAGSGLFNDIK